MSTLLENAQRMVRLFENLRSIRSGPAFEQLKQLNLSFSHLRALHLLAQDHVLTMKDLAEQLKLTPPSVTVLVRRLVQIGLVERTPHAEDNRVVLLKLTEAGHALLTQLTQEQIGAMADLLRGLSQQEQIQFLDLLERAVNTLQANAHAANTTDNTGSRR